MESAGIAPLILNLVTRWRCVVKLKPLPLYPDEKSVSTTKFGAGWAQGPSGGFVEEISYTCWDSNPGLCSPQFVVPTQGACRSVMYGTDSQCLLRTLEDNKKNYGVEEVITLEWIVRKYGWKLWGSLVCRVTVRGPAVVRRGMNL
jgi:hypothetical protein